MFIPPVCELLKTPFLYGFEDPSHLFHKVVFEVQELDRKIKECEVKRAKNRDTRNQIAGATRIKFDYENKEQADRDIEELIKDDWLLNNELQQLKGSKATYEYLQKNWVCRWYPGGKQ